MRVRPRLTSVATAGGVRAVRLRGVGRAGGTGPGGQGGGGGAGGRRAVRALRGAGAAGGRHAAARPRAAPLRRLAVARAHRWAGRALRSLILPRTAPRHIDVPRHDYREDDIICNTGVAVWKSTAITIQITSMKSIEERSS